MSAADELSGAEMARLDWGDGAGGANILGGRTVPDCISLRVAKAACQDKSAGHNKTFDTTKNQKYHCIVEQTGLLTR